MTVLKNQLSLFARGRRRPPTDEGAVDEASTDAQTPVDAASAEDAPALAEAPAPALAEAAVEAPAPALALVVGEPAPASAPDVEPTAADAPEPAESRAATESPVEPAAEAPAAAEPVSEEPASEAPAAAEPVSEEPAAEAPVAEVAPEPAVEAPAQPAPEAEPEPAPKAAKAPEAAPARRGRREQFLFPPADATRRADLHFSRRISDLIRRLQLMERETKKGQLGLTLPQAHALHALEEAGSLRMQELAGALGLAQSTVTRLVAPLKRMGLLDRRPDRNDGRATRAFLTDAGRQSVDELEAAERQMYEALLQRLPATRRAEVVAAIELLHDAVLDASTDD